jgi:hypothetical protein
VVRQRQWFESLPEFVAKEREVDGFLELVAAIVRARSR